MSDRDERLATLLTRLEDDCRAGRPPAIEALAHENSDLADELRQLWTIAQVAHLAGRSDDQQETIPRALDVPSGTLPRNFGDYELLQELGRGGMGIVYKAKQRGLDRVVALKMLLHADVASPADRARIRAEAKAAALLQHPNIVPVYDVGEADGRDYFTMPFIEGRSLAQVLAEGPLPPREAARLVATLALAVEHAHSRGIIHRDLKPANVLLESSGKPEARATDADAFGLPLNDNVPKITDFGLAKDLAVGGENLTQTGAILGTPSYMPPEQAASNRGQIGPASDIYSLGAILYSCLTGRPPFQAATRWDTVFLVLDQDPVPPRLLNPAVGRDLEIICLKCLQKPPELRYASAADLAADLEAFLNGETLSIGPGELREIIGRIFRPTHHVAILENWGGLWMAHSLFTLLLCLLTWGMQRLGIEHRWPYMTTWFAGVMIWAGIFWRIRRRIGPVTFVERQIAHVWAAGVAGSFAVLVLEWMLGAPVLQFAPLLAITAAMVFLCKAGILSGLFYLATGALFSAAVLMVWQPDWAMLIYGVALAGCYFIPGWIFYHRRRAGTKQNR
jgi:serine/threonine protein kinase